MRSVVGVIADVAGGIGMLLCIPLAILAIGIPLALGVRLLLWTAGWL